MLAMVDHFGSHVLKRPAEGVSLAFVHLAIVVRLHLTLTRPTKVTYLQNVVFVHEQIFRLQIAMNKTILVEEVDSGHCLDKEIKCRIFREAFVLSDQGE